jgi:hypothetical protein
MDGCDSRERESTSRNREAEMVGSAGPERLERPASGLSGMVLVQTRHGEWREGSSGRSSGSGAGLEPERQPDAGGVYRDTEMAPNAPEGREDTAVSEEGGIGGSEGNMSIVGKGGV